jgi:hypothetical protein
MSTVRPAPHDLAPAVRERRGRAALELVDQARGLKSSGAGAKDTR